MKHSTNRSIGMAFMLTGALLLCAPALHAAITDADLAKVTQLIQEGKTTRAKAEITILLDDNPNDPNAPKLRKILDSLGNQNAGNASKPSGQDGGPSAEETFQWIQSHIDLGVPDMRGTSLKSVELRDGKLTFLIEHVESDSQGAVVDLQSYTLDPADVTGEVEQSSSSLTIVTKPKKIKRTTIHSSWRGDWLWVDDEKVGNVLIAKVDQGAETESRLKDGKGKHEMTSKCSFSVSEAKAERLKKAFDHLIQLHGGGKAEAF